jgi:GntR family transcriptional repressor for pyruvate dehydrogenase complex
MFQKIEREATLADMVSRQIQSMIVERQLKPNDRLPAERDLAEQLGVSRTVVREAVRSLAAKGLLEVVPGRGGTVVRSPTTESMAEMMSLFLRGDERTLDYENLIEVRRVLETAIAGIAAERRTADDLAEMQGILDQTLKIGNDREAFVKWDLEFHKALARATHNRLFALLLESVNELMIEVRRLAFKTHGAPARSYCYHGAIFEQVQAKKPESAREAMREHLVEAEVTLRKALTMQKRKPAARDKAHRATKKT